MAKRYPIAPLPDLSQAGLVPRIIRWKDGGVPQGF
jgi:hypothetical protein